MERTPEEKNSSGEELLSRLRNFAIGLSSGELSDEIYDLKDYTVTLFYEDIEGDKVWLCTGEDMFNAVLEYEPEKRMRVYAMVRPNNTKESSPSPAAATTMSSDKSTTTTTAETSTATTQTTAPAVAKSVPTPPTADVASHNSNKDLVDAVTDLLTCVAVTVNAGLNSANPTAVIKQAKKASKEAAKQAKKMSKEAVKQVKKASKMEAAAAAAPPAATEQNEPPVSTPEPEPKKGSTEKKEPPVSTPEPEQVEMPFIHGRHTCDQCLTTPIVGKRYHAVSLPDYDLCEKCFQNYDGKEIQFEEAQLGK